MSVFLFSNYMRIPNDVRKESSESSWIYQTKVDSSELERFLWAILSVNGKNKYSEAFIYFVLD